MKPLFVIALILLISANAKSQITLKIDEAVSSQNSVIKSPDESPEIFFSEEKQYTNHEIQTVFNRNKRNGFYGSISLGYSPIDNKHGAVFSSRGCIIMDRWFAIGLGGTAFINNIDKINNIYTPNNQDNLTGAYGGLVLEPIAFPMKPLHISFPVLIGGGVVVPFNEYNHTTYNYIEDYYFVIEPGIELEVNFTRWLRIAAFATYRHTSEIEIPEVSKNALRSYSTGLTFKIGLF